MDHQQIHVITGAPASLACLAAVSAVGDALETVATNADGVLAPNLIELLAASLRAVSEDESGRDRLFQLMARVLDLHLADSVAPVRTGRWARETLDALLGVLSVPLLHEVQSHLGRADQAGAVRGPSATTAAQPHP